MMYVTHELLHYSRNDALSMTKQSRTIISYPGNTHVDFFNLKSL
jgi:hypothetical protein